MKYIHVKQFVFILFIGTHISFSQIIDHSDFNLVLYKYVKDGLVDYKALKENSDLLSHYLNQIENINPSDFENWPENEKIAMWTNAYNAITLHGILLNYPIKGGSIFSKVRFPKNSIRQIKNFWDTVFIKVMGKELTLNDIEHSILRKKYKDPRIHFVLVCASIGCPSLENQAFDGESLEKRLEKATLNFIQNPEKVKIDIEKNALYLSSIFNWYKKDFTATDVALEKFNIYDKKHRGILNFISNYLSQDDVLLILKDKKNIKFLDYDWALNEQK